MTFFQLSSLPKFVSRHFGKWTLPRTSSLGSDLDLAHYQTALNHSGALMAMITWCRASRRQLHVSPMPSLRVETPKQITWRANDAFFEPGLAESSFALCTDGKLEIVAGATHWVQHKAADEVNRL